MNLDKAKILALQFHGDQRYGDKNYFLGHLIPVSDRVIKLFMPLLAYIDGEYRDMAVMGLLHDILEDTDCSIKDLEDAGAEAHIIQGISDLTRDFGMNREEYLTKVKNSSIKGVKEVKIADALCNLEECIKTNDPRKMKYIKTLQFLLED